jgi:hypothetical protein
MYKTSLEAFNAIICPVNSAYGAPMGRMNVGKVPISTKIRIYDRYVPLYGDYDKGGAYWGSGNGCSRLRVRYTLDLAYVMFYREKWEWEILGKIYRIL